MATYPGRCRAHIIDPQDLQRRLASSVGSPLATALRIRLEGDVRFTDAIQGPQGGELEQQTGDVIVHRRDGIVAYALAAAVDDTDGIDDVVRGADLLDATAAHVAIMQRLDAPVPNYAHLPVLVDKQGRKLGKQTSAPGIVNPLQALSCIWELLEQPAIKADTPTEFLHQARNHWQSHNIPAQRALRVPT